LTLQYIIPFHDPRHELANKPLRRARAVAPAPEQIPMIQYAIQAVLFAASALLLFSGMAFKNAGVTNGDTYQIRIDYAIVGVGVVFAIFAIFWPGKNRRDSN
jgi:hypothetical protein